MRRLRKYCSISCIIRFKIYLNTYVSAEKQKDFEIFLDNKNFLVYNRFFPKIYAYILAHLTFCNIYFFTVQKNNRFQQYIFCHWCIS